MARSFLGYKSERASRRGSAAISPTPRKRELRAGTICFTARTGEKIESDSRETFESFGDAAGERWGLVVLGFARFRGRLIL